MARLQHERKPKHIRIETFIPTPYNWTIHEDVKDDDFKPLVDMIINSNQSININGAPGTGKSTLIKQIHTELTSMNKTFTTLAPTNKACSIVNGMTLHRYASKIKRMKDVVYIRG